MRLKKLRHAQNWFLFLVLLVVPLAGADKHPSNPAPKHAAAPKAAHAARPAASSRPASTQHPATTANRPAATSGRTFGTTHSTSTATHAPGTTSRTTTTRTHTPGATTRTSTTATHTPGMTTRTTATRTFANGTTARVGRRPRPVDPYREWDHHHPHGGRPAHGRQHAQRAHRGQHRAGPRLCPASLLQPRRPRLLSAHVCRGRAQICLRL
jgi:hypothetical protein